VTALGLRHATVGYPLAIRAAVGAIVNHFSDSGSDMTQSNYMAIRHSDGTVAGYGHTQQHGATVRVGKSVAQGLLDQGGALMVAARRESRHFIGSFACLYASTKVLQKRVAGSFSSADILTSSNVRTTRG
jgi:hypothetical protein